VFRSSRVLHGIQGIDQGIGEAFMVPARFLSVVDAKWRLLVPVAAISQK